MLPRWLKHDGNLTLEDRMNTLDASNLRPNIPEYIVIHATLRHPEFEELLNAHRGLGWAGVGYHIFVSRTNKIYQARPFDVEGAHALGFNTRSIGVCFYTNNLDTLNKRQVQIGHKIVKYLKERYRDISVIPHTLAQIIYINSLLKEAGVEKLLPEELDVVDNKKFQDIKQEADTLSMMCDKSIRSRIKELRNCPGPLFAYFKQNG